jgi:class 3 adenylate cyclase
MIGRVISPVLVGRQQELSELEDALLSANRGDGRFVLLGGEAGIGKTRLARELARRAGKLGSGVLWGSCSEAELPLPYLPFVEAIGARLDEREAGTIRAELGPRAAELAQVFPQLREGPPSPAAADPEAKVRLFEAVVGLLELWARDRALLLVIDDIHWADSSTRELLEYAARRLERRRVMLLATYRSDELDRLHPLTRAVQTWRRGGLAQVVSVGAMTRSQAGQMIAAVLGADDLSDELASFIHERSEGNPFVLEEMLREAVDRGEVFQSDGRWERRSVDAFELPDTVREALLLRLGRLDPEHVEVLRAAAVLGRSFDYGVLVRVAEADESQVLGALETAVAQQLLDEVAEAGRYTWRHALTQEAIVGDTVLPKRMRAHSRAADVLGADGGSGLVVARHLLAAGRSAEAVTASLRAADEAELASGFSEATELLERILPNVVDERDHALVLYRMGRLRWLNGEPGAAAQLLEDGIRQLDALGLHREAAEARVHLSRCYWELHRSAESLETVEQARETLAEDGPSAELALADIRIAGLYAFELEYETCREVAERGETIAEEAGADFERLWARSFLALGYFGTARHLDLFAECYEEALAKGYSIIAGNTTHNEIWDRVHCLAGGLQPVAERYVEVPFLAWALGVEVSQSWAALALGDPRGGLEHARSALERHTGLGNPKFEWRAGLAVAEALVELGRTDEAAAELPPPSPGGELQDVAYDTPARMRIAIAQGHTEEALQLARRASSEDLLVRVPQTFALAVEGFLAADALDEAAALVERAKTLPFELGEHAVWLSEGHVLLAQGRPAEARPLLQRAADRFEELDLRLWFWRAQALTAEATAGTGDAEAAAALFASAIHGAHAASAHRIRDDALAAANRVGVEVPELPDEPEPEVEQPGVLAAGERLVTSMFADVRGYTPIAAAAAPDDLADRMTTLHRWAAAEVGKRQGVVDKFAGDAVMATFNATGARLDHALEALDAALALRDKAALMDLPLGIGIAVGPAVVSRSVDEGNLSVLGTTTNLAARLQTAAAGGDILLSDEAYRRVATWLEERGLSAEPERLELKGFDGAQPAYRLASPVSG